MKHYLVKIPIIAVASVETEATSLEEGLPDALLDASLEHVGDDWEAYPSVNEGNHSKALINKAYLDASENEIKVPISAVAEIEVEATSADEAIEEARLDVSLMHIGDNWKALPIITEGNLFHGLLMKAEVAKQ